jgi:CDGSH-type Zn-finger protein
MADVKIQTVKNGPYLVSGIVELVDAEGRSFTLNKASFALCRCGGSVNKPFCDGTHSRLGFQAAEAAVAAAESK